MGRGRSAWLRVGFAGRARRRRARVPEGHRCGDPPGRADREIGLRCIVRSGWLHLEPGSPSGQRVRRAHPPDRGGAGRPACRDEPIVSQRSCRAGRLCPTWIADRGHESRETRPSARPLAIPRAAPGTWDRGPAPRALGGRPAAAGRECRARSGGRGNAHAADRRVARRPVSRRALVPLRSARSPRCQGDLG